MPQIRVGTNRGVTLSALDGTVDACLEGWKAMMSDMILFSKSFGCLDSDMSFFLSRNVCHGRSCWTRRPGKTSQTQVHMFVKYPPRQRSMTCLDDISTWLFRSDTTTSSNRMIMYTQNYRLPRRYPNYPSFPIGVVTSKTKKRI